MLRSARGRRLILVGLCGWLLSNGSAAHAQFTPEPPFTYELILQELIGLDHADIAWGDQDLDGDLDLLMSGMTANGPVAAVSMNLSETCRWADTGFEDCPAGEGSVPEWTQHYDERTDGIAPVWLGRVSWIDFNNDGLLEFVISGTAQTAPPYDPVTTMYAPISTQYVTVPGIDLAGVIGGSMDWGDYDNDGDPDLLLTGQRHDDVVSILYENRAGELIDSGIPVPRSSIGQARFGDFDSDGDLDIVMTAVHTPTGLSTTLLENVGGSFGEVETAMPGLGFSSVDWGDYDNDGDLDILLSGGALSPLVVQERTRVFRNDGGGVFVDIEALVDDAAFGASRWGDYDNDGLLDIVISGSKGIEGEVFTRLYRNEGDDNFVAAINLASLKFGQLGFGDYDADGDLDVVVSGDGRTVQYRNDHRRVNNRPSPPTNLRTEKSGGSVTLRWDPADDFETASPGLTYNIRIGSAPASLDVLSPMSDVTTGQRMVARMGNVQNNESWTVAGLPAGTYYWSVQSIDHSFSGSGWADEGSFVIESSGGTKVAGETDEVPTEAALVRAFPNPFDTGRGGATIEFHSTGSQHVSVRVYSALGSHVATLAERHVGPGDHRFRWGGDAGGVPLGPGVYFVRVVGERIDATIRLIQTGI